MVTILLILFGIIMCLAALLRFWKKLMFSAQFDGEETSSAKLPIVSCAIMLAIGVASFVSISPLKSIAAANFVVTDFKISGEVSYSLYETGAPVPVPKAKKSETYKITNYSIFGFSSPPSESSSLVSDEGVAKEAVYLFTVENGDSKVTMVVAEKDVEVILHDENSTYLISHTEEYGYLWRLFSSQFPMPDEKTTYKLLVHGSTN